jgi:hypothetical protein
VKPCLKFKHINNSNNDCHHNHKQTDFNLIFSGVAANNSFSCS